MFKKVLTSTELEKLEVEKNEALHKAQEEIQNLQGKRSEILLRMADEDPAAPAELKKFEARITELKTDCEVIEALLQTIPVRKAYARGLEIESLIPSIEKMATELQPLAADISKKAAPLIAACNKLYDFMDGFASQKEIQSIGLQSDFLYGGVNTLRSAGTLPSATAAGDKHEVDFELILLAMVYDKDKLTAWINRAQESITQRLDRMCDHAKRLKGEAVPESDWPYCPNCFENVGYPDAKGKTHCAKCNTTF